MHSTRGPPDAGKPDRNPRSARRLRRRRSGAWHRPGHSAWPMPGPGRRVRLRQVGHRTLHPAPAAGSHHRHLRTDPLCRRRSGRGQRRTFARTARRPHCDDLPGADDLAEPAAHGGTADRRGAHPAQGPARQGDARAGAGIAGTGRHPGAGQAAAGLPASTLRRAAATGDDRHGAGQRTGAADRRRTHHGAGRHRATEDSAVAQGPAAAPGHVAAADHP